MLLKAQCKLVKTVIAEKSGVELLENIEILGRIT